MSRLRALTAASAVFFQACGELPTGEAPPPLNLPQGSLPPGTQLVLPGPSPAPSPSGGPTPSPQPAPSTPPPSSSSCSLPAMPECGAPEGPEGVFGCCQRGTPAESQFGGIVDDAIARLQVEQPNLFNGNRVVDAAAYV